MKVKRIRGICGEVAIALVSHQKERKRKAQTKKRSVNQRTKKTQGEQEKRGDSQSRKGLQQWLPELFEL